MTGHLRTLTVAKKFWPKRAKAVAEGAIALGDDIEDALGHLGDLRIDDPTEGATVEPLHAVTGSGARPSVAVELWRIERDEGKLLHFADTVADEAGDFAFAGDTPFPLGELTIYALAGVEQAPPVTFTVAEATAEEEPCP